MQFLKYFHFSLTWLTLQSLQGVLVALNIFSLLLWRQEQAGSPEPPRSAVWGRRRRWTLQLAGNCQLVFAIKECHFPTPPLTLEWDARCCWPLCRHSIDSLISSAPEHPILTPPHSCSQTVNLPAMTHKVLNPPFASTSLPIFSYMAFWFRLKGILFFLNIKNKIKKNHWKQYALSTTASLRAPRTSKLNTRISFCSPVKSAVI